MIRVYVTVAALLVASCLWFAVAWLERARARRYESALRRAHKALSWGPTGADLASMVLEDALERR
jgi:hypothetical protein